MSVGMRPIEELSGGELRELDEMLEEGKSDVNVPWDEAEHFQRFVLDEYYRPIGIYAVRSGHGVADVRAWLRPHRRNPDVAMGAVEMIASHLASRVVTTFSRNGPSLVGFDEASARRLLMIIEPLDL